MNRLFFILALSGILMQNFSKVYILLQFKINQNYIAKNLCVKKDLPNNCCKGSCHLEKQLEKEEKKESQSGNQLKEKFEIELFFQKSVYACLPINTIVDKLYTMYVFTVPEKMLHSIFHPPQA